MRIGSLFSGAGGLDMAVEAVFGGHTVWHAEVDKAASTVLAYRWPEVPNLGSVTEIDWAAVEPVDVLCGGFPCQDVSAAGKRAGIKDGTRSGLWSVFAEAIDILRPPIVVIENVRGLLNAAAHRVEPDETTLGDGAGGPVLRAAGAVLGDLADLGYDAQWATVAAADVGAPHRRERVFIVAAVAECEGGAGGDAELHDLRQGNRGAGKSGISPRGGAVDCGASADSAVRGREARVAESEGFWREPVTGTGSAEARDGLDLLLPTPMAQQSGCSPEDHLRKKPGRKVVTDLAILVENGLLETGGALLPTPTCQDGKNTAGPSQHRRNTRPLNAEVTLLPTPSAVDGAGAGRHSSEGHQSTLPGEVRLLPTPKARDGGQGDCPSDRREGHTRQLIDFALLAGSTAWGKYEPAIRRWENLTRPAPPPTEPNKNGNPRLAAAFSEWLMGWPAGWVTDPAIGISRNDQLRIVGNGVCPQQAAAALRYLLAVATGSGIRIATAAPAELLPTPCVVDRLATGDMTLQEWDESRRDQKEKGVGSFGPRVDSLGAAVLRVEEGTVDQRPDYSTTKRRRP